MGVILSFISILLNSLVVTTIAAVAVREIFGDHGGHCRIHGELILGPNLKLLPVLYVTLENKNIKHNNL